jgi:ankyrin repeat protein
MSKKRKPTIIQGPNLVAGVKKLSKKHRKRALTLAAQQGNVDVLEALHDAGVDVNFTEKDGLSPLGASSINGHTDFVRRLLELGADPNPVDKPWSSPLFDVAECGEILNFRFPIDIGENTEIIRHAVYNPLIGAAIRNQAEVVRLLAESGAATRLELNDGSIMSALVAAATAGNHQVVQYLLEREDYLSSWPQEAGEALMAACSFGHEDVVSVLVEKGFDVNRLTDHGFTPIMTAIRSGNERIVCLLLESGADQTLSGLAGSALHVAVHLGQNGIAKMLLEKGYEVNTLDELGTTPLSSAACRDDLEMVEFLLKKGAQSNVDTSCPFPPLCCAAENGNAEMVKLLLSRGAIPECQDRYGSTPLVTAVRKGYSQIAEILLEAGADVEARDEESNTPFIIATLNGSTEILEKLGSAGADTNAVNRDNQNALSIARAKKRPELETLLKSLGAVEAKVEPKSNNEISAEGLERKRRNLLKKSLFEAARSGDMETLEAVFDLVSEVDVRDDSGATPFMVAGVEGHFDIADLLLDMGAEPNAQDERGYNALTRAARLKRKNAKKYLKSKGCERQIIDSPKKKSKKRVVKRNLISAATAQDMNLVRELLVHDRDPNAVDPASGKTALLIAVAQGNREMVRELLDHGADPNLCNKNTDFSPLMIASRDGYSSLARDLLVAGADPNHRGHAGFTPLFLAVQKENEEIAGFIVLFGADIDAKDSKGRTVLDVVKRKSKIGEILQSYQSIEDDPPVWHQTVIRAILASADEIVTDPSQPYQGKARGMRFSELMQSFKAVREKRFGASESVPTSDGF